MGSLMSLLLLFIYIELIVSEIRQSITYKNKIYLSIYKAIQSDEMKVKVTVKYEAISVTFVTFLSIFG